MHFLELATSSAVASANFSSKRMMTFIHLKIVQHESRKKILEQC